MGAELRRLGVATEPAAAGCPAVRAVVELDANGGIAVAVRGAVRGSEGRVVSDAAVAAAWIDSWLRDDIDVALWSPPPPRVAIVEEPAVVAPRDVAPAPPKVSTPWLARGAVSASYEQAWTNDGAAWSGFAGSACLKVGRLCLGARVHAGTDPERLVGSTGVERTELMALATASLALEVGRMTIAPELGLGVGRINTRRVDACEPPPPQPNTPPPGCNPMDPTDPNCMPPAPEQCASDPTMMVPNGDPSGKVYVGDGFDHVTYGPRIAVGLRVAVPLFQHVWLEGLAALTLAPLSHAADFLPLETPEFAAPEAVLLPGEPQSAYQLGIGLRIGAP